MPETTPSRLPTDSVTFVPCTSMTSPATRGNSATIWLTIACSGADEAVGACRAGVWAHGSETPQRIARRTAGATNAAALRRFIRDTISPQARDRGAPRFTRGVTNVGGLGGHLGAPQLQRQRARRCP